MNSFNLTDLRIAVHEKCVAARNMDRLIQTTKFAEACKIADVNLIASAILEFDILAVQTWMNTAFIAEFGDFSLRALRAMAARLGVKYYTSMTKELLLINISQERQLQNASQIKEAVS